MVDNGCIITSNNTMIVGFFYLLAGSVLHLLGILLNIVSVLIPEQIGNALVWFFSKTAIFNGIFPVGTLFEALSWLLVILFAVWMGRLAIWALNLIPGINIVYPLGKWGKQPQPKTVIIQEGKAGFRTRD